MHSLDLSMSWQSTGPICRLEDAPNRLFVPVKETSSQTGADDQFLLSERSEVAGAESHQGQAAS